MLGYRPSVKTVRRGPGQDLRVLICKESKVASWRIQVLLWDRSSRSYEPDRAAAVTACIFDRQKKDSLIFSSGSQDSDCTKCTAKGHPKWIWFSKMRKWALDFKWREFYFPSKRGLGGRPVS